ncbi:MAG: hypothetical protein JWP97_1798, partial [Labilithrix sp.]|nr:hypothetical protein [Labilithrix sp.]
PPPLGSATFLRAAAAWGFSLRLSSTARALPFALARDPYPASAHRYAYAFASAVAEPGFQRRVLDLPARTASAQARVLRLTMFLYARVVAARGILLAEENVTSHLFEELTSRLFGAPLPATMRDAWPEPRTAAPAEVLGLFGALPFVRDLVHRYDEDWYRNPSAGRHLVGIACGPAFDPEPHELPEKAPEALARAFEETLG